MVKQIWQYLMFGSKNNVNVWVDVLQNHDFDPTKRRKEYNSPVIVIGRGIL